MQTMSDIEDGELLSSDNEDYNQPPGEEEKEQKSNNKDKSYVDTNNNFQNNVIDNRNFHKNDDAYRYNKKRNSNSPRLNDRKRNYRNRIDPVDNKKMRKSIKSENKEKEYLPPLQNDVINDFKTEHQNFPEKTPAKRRILCKYYAGGECKNGYNCAFMHEDFPCKFFHDKTTVCRAGNDCKYSHAPLSDDMQIVMDCFIQEGKEHKVPFSAPPSAPNYNTTSVHNRTKCLLPTPVMNAPLPNSNQHQFNNQNIPPFQEFHVEETHDKPLRTYNDNHVGNYKTKYVDPLVRNTYNSNKPRFPVTQEFHPKLAMNQFSRNPPDYFNKSHFVPFTDLKPHVYTETPRNEKYVSDFYPGNTEPLSPSEININEPPPSCNVRINHPIITSQQVSYNNHAPARFIIGNNTQSNAPKLVNTSFDLEFREALKKLAEQVIADPVAEMPLSPENSNNTEENLDITIEPTKEESVAKNFPIKEEPEFKNLAIKEEPSFFSAPKEEKIVMPTVRIAENTSIFNINENELSESDKQYINEMRSLINLDAQFENIIPWVAIKLESTKKQPYILFSFKVENVHESASSDPRLTGHPVLRAIENQNDQDEMSNQNSLPHSDADDNNDVENNDENSDEGLTIDMDRPGQQKPNCDTRSYLYDCKFKRKKISGQLML